MEASDESIIINKMGYSEESYNVLKDKFGMNNGKRLKWYANQLLADLKQSGIAPTEAPRILDYIQSSKFNDKFANVEDWVKGMARENTPLKLNDYTLDQAVESATEWHKELADRSDNDEPNEFDDTEEELLHKYKDGMYWVNLNTDECSREGKRMGHCGTTNKDTLLSLRDKKGESKVTISISKTYKTIGQIKGRSNKRPISKYDEYIVDLIIRLGVERYEPEYLPSKDFQPYAVKSEELKSQLRKHAPEYVSSTQELLEKDDKVLWDYIRREKGYDEATSDELRRIKEWDIDTYTMDMAIFKGDPIPTNRTLELTEDYFLSLDKSDKLPPEVQKFILDTPMWASYYASNVIKKPTPYFEKYIGKEAHASMYYAETFFHGNGKPVPDTIANGIAMNPHKSARYAREASEVPDVILQSALQDPEYILQHVTEQGTDTLTDDMIKALSKDPINGIKVALRIKRDKNPVPKELIVTFDKNANIAYEAISNILGFEDVPPELYKAIGKDPDKSLLTALGLEKRGKAMPEFVIAGIAKNASASKRYIQDIIEYKDIPEIVAKGVAINPKMCGTLLVDFFKNHDGDIKDMPEPIVKSGVSAEHSVATYIAIQQYKGEDIPEYVIAGFDDYVEDVEKYAIFKQGVGLSDSMVETLVKHPSNIINVARQIDFVTDLDKRLIIAVLDKFTTAIQFKHILQDENIDIDDLFDTEDGEDDELELDMIDRLHSVDDE
jgi:hypothetical protein